MLLSLKIIERLDKFGPYGSGIGSASPILIYYCFQDFFEKQHFNDYNLWIISISLSYFFCTCTHRILIFFSLAAVGGVLGSILGNILGPFTVYFFTAGAHDPGIFRSLGILSNSFLLFVFPFLFSKTICNLINKREIQNQKTIHLQQNNIYCRFCDSIMTNSQICPRCGRRNP